MGVATNEDEQREAMAKSVNKSMVKVREAEQRLRDAIAKRDEALHAHKSEIGTASKVLQDAIQDYKRARKRFIELTPENVSDPALGLE